MARMKVEITIDSDPSVVGDPQEDVGVLVQGALTKMLGHYNPAVMEVTQVPNHEMNMLFHGLVGRWDCTCGEGGNTFQGAQEHSNKYLRG